MLHNTILFIIGVLILDNNTCSHSHNKTLQCFESESEIVVMSYLLKITLAKRPFRSWCEDFIHRRDGQIRTDCLFRLPHIKAQTGHNDPYLLRDECRFFSVLPWSRASQWANRNIISHCLFTSV